jgi:amino acid transporter
MSNLLTSMFLLARGIAFHSWRCATGRPRYQDLSDTWATYFCLCAPAAAWLAILLAVEQSISIFLCGCLLAAIALLLRRQHSRRQRMGPSGPSMLCAGCLVAGACTINLIFLALGVLLFESEIGFYVLLVKVVATVLSMIACKKKFNQLPHEMQWAGYRPQG